MTPRRSEDAGLQAVTQRAAKYLPIVAFLTGLTGLGSCAVMAFQVTGWRGQTPAQVMASMEETVKRVADVAHTETGALRVYVDSAVQTLAARDSTFQSAIGDLRDDLRTVQANDEGQTALLCVIADGIDARLAQAARVDCDNIIRRRQTRRAP